MAQAAAEAATSSQATPLEATANMRKNVPNRSQETQARRALPCPLALTRLQLASRTARVI